MDHRDALKQHPELSWICSQHDEEIEFLVDTLRSGAGIVELFPCPNPTPVVTFLSIHIYPYFYLFYLSIYKEWDLKCIQLFPCPNPTPVVTFLFYLSIYLFISIYISIYFIYQSIKNGIGIVELFPCPNPTPVVTYLFYVSIYLFISIYISIYFIYLSINNGPGIVELFPCPNPAPVITIHLSITNCNTQPQNSPSKNIGLTTTTTSIKMNTKALQNFFLVPT